MAALFEFGGPVTEEETEPGAGSGVTVVAGYVTGNRDTPMDGKVLVRIPALEQEVWARLVAPGAGPGAGLFYLPRVDDEVLVALAGDDPRDAFVLGGLWNARDRIPTGDPVTAMTSRVLRSGMTAARGHQLTMDDARQSVSITTSTDQRITMTPTSIELANLAGSVTITMDNTAQSISLKAASAISLEAPRISLKGAQVEIHGATSAEMTSAGACSVTAPLVKIN